MRKEAYTMNNKREKSKIIKVLTVLASAFMVGIIVCMAYADSVKLPAGEAAAVTDIPVIPDSVEIGGKTYTKENPLKVIEVVPVKNQAELGFLMGREYYPVRFEDIKQLILDRSKGGDATLVNEAKGLLRNWYYRMGTVYGSQYNIQFYIKGADGNYGWTTGFPNDDRAVFDEQLNFRVIKASDSSRLLYSDTESNVYETTNLFAKSVFGDYSMADKMVYEVKTLDELSKTDMESADLIYINTAAGCRDGAFFNFYTEANRLMPEKCPLPYTSQKKFVDLGQDFSGELAWCLYRKIAASDTAVVFDTNGIDTYFGAQSNAMKVVYMLNGADKEMFRQNCWAEELVPDREYRGDFARLVIEDNTINIYYTRVNPYNTAQSEQNKKLEWDRYMFIDNNKQAFLYSLNYIKGQDYTDYYFNSQGEAWSTGGSSGNRDTNVWDNVFIYGGWDTMLSQIPAGQLNANEAMHGSSFSDLLNLYGKDGVISVGSSIRYILGDYAKITDNTGKVRVLEIEPAGAYAYDTLDREKLLRIFRYLRISTKGLSITDSSCGQYVEVRTAAMNEFIAMTEDIVNNYDLIIIGDTVDEKYKSKFLQTVYSEQGAGVIYTDYDTWTKYNMVYSGNDLTDKAYAKIEKYAKKGRPLVLADSIYSGDTGRINTASNVYKLKALSAGRTNVMDESLNKTQNVKYTARPIFSEKTGYSVVYDANGIISTNLNAAALSEFDFSIAAGAGNKEYILNVYVDRDANGEFDYSTGENNERLYSQNIITDAAGGYTASLSLPQGIRGYLKWKAVLTDAATGLSSDEEGAFVVAYTNTEIKDVKVLQISPQYGSTLSIKNSQRFIDYFNASSEITGLRLVSDNITEMTAEKFEDIYNPDKGGRKYAGEADDRLIKRGEQGYDIVILGFGDIYGYEDIDDTNGALSNLEYYIKSGNSVLMSHDVMSYTTYSDKNVTNQNVSFKEINTVAQLGNRYAGIIPGMTDDEAAAVFRGWSYQLTSRLRNIVGMDRYNVALTTDKKNTVGDYTQGYSNSMNIVNGKYYSNKAGRINSGQINMYPYGIGDDVPVARTHSQYYQLNLEDIPDEEDIVVWYALNGDESNNTYKYFESSGKDALNNYYIYSKGNITYTGAGHSNLDDSQMELKLFVNTIIRAIGASNNIPKVSYRDALEIDNRTYEMPVRDGNIPEKVYFTAWDEDFFGEAGSFKESYVFVDTNGDERYDSNDILIRTYDGSANPLLKNAEENELSLNEIVNGMSAENRDRITELFAENQLTLTVQVKDNNNGIGTSVLHMINKKLFELN